MSVTITKGTAVAAQAGVTVAFPTGVVAGDWLVVWGATKPDTPSTIATFGTTPSGTTNQVSTNGAGSAADTGDTALTVRWARAVGTESGASVVITDADDSVSWGHAFCVHSTVGFTDDVAVVKGKDDTGSSNYSASCTGDGSESFRTGDVLLSATALPTDASSGAAWSGLGYAGSGLTFDTITEEQENFSPLGSDIGGVTASARVASGSVTGGPAITFSGTLAVQTNSYGPTIILGFREALTGTSAVAPSVALATTGGALGTSAVTPSATIATTGGASGSSAVAAAVAIATTGALIFTGTSAVAPSVDIATTGALGVPASVDIAPNVAIVTTGSATSGVAVAPSVAIATTGAPTGTAAVAPVIGLATTGRTAGSGSVTVAVSISTTGALVFTGTSAVAPSVAIATTGIIAIPPTEGGTSNGDDGLFIDGTALVEWEPAVVATPAVYQNILAMDTARAIQLTGIGAAGQPLITVQDKRTQRARDRILIGGYDVTYFRGVKTPTPDYRLIKPLLWGSATLVLPQVSPQYERLGVDATVPVLKKIKADALVVVQRVLNNVVIATDYVGFIDAINTSGSELSLTLGGHASGRASNDIEPAPIFRAKHDMKFQVLNYLQTLNLHTASTDEVIGIPLYDRGGSDGLTLVNELVSLAVTADGDTFDVAPDDNRVYDMYETDRETIHATVYLDDALAKQQLDRAFSEESNIVYATSRTASGQIVNNAKAPGLVQYAADFPGTLEQDDTGATALNNQLTVAGYLNYQDSDNVDLFDLDTYYAVVEFQYDAGLPTDGVVDEATWDALWNIGDLGWTIKQARIFPMAQRSYTRKFDFAGNGSKLGENSDYDPHRIKRAVSLDFGSGINRRRAKRMARSRLAPEDVSNWQGTLSLTSGVIVGEHTPGDAITEADVMPARGLRPGMNLWMPLFDGGTLFHIVTADVSNDGGNVELHIDTQARDSIPLWEVIARNRETRSSVARRVSGQVRSSQVMQDSVADWTDICGFLPAATPLVGGEWTLVMVPAGQEGIVNTIRMQLETPAEFAVLLMEKEIPGGPPVLTPLTDPRPSQRPWWERDTIVDALKEFGYLAAWGTPDQPCGYDPGLKTDDQGATGDEVTGLFREEAGLNYTAAVPGRLPLYVWVGADNALNAGKILEQQLTPGF